MAPDLREGLESLPRITAGRIAVHTSNGDDVWLVTGGTVTYDAKKGENSMTLRTNRGHRVIPEGKANWNGSGSGTLSIEVWKSKIESRSSIQASGTIQP